MAAAPQRPEKDLAALSRIRGAAIVAMVGAAASAAISVVLSTGGYLRFAPTTTTTLPTFTSMFLFIFLGVELAAFAALVASFELYREGFVELRDVDTRFSSSPTFALLAMIGFVILAVGLLVLLLALYNIVSCAGHTLPIPLGCLQLGTLLGGVALAGIGGIVALIGVIGTLVAIWRLGERYAESLFKVGAILLIIPFLNIVGQILIFVAARGATSRIQQHPGPGFAPSFLAPPPPMR
ncbi:MAG: DUF973 family protein [Thermoplasmata archaeon]|nr:DUF973 family protein [Thermoplasmata archaeon]